MIRAVISNRYSVEPLRFRAVIGYGSSFAFTVFRTLEGPRFLCQNRMLPAHDTAPPSAPRMRALQRAPQYAFWNTGSTISAPRLARRGQVRIDSLRVSSSNDSLHQIAGSNAEVLASYKQSAHPDRALRRYQHRVHRRQMDCNPYKDRAAHHTYNGRVTESQRYRDFHMGGGRYQCNCLPADRTSQIKTDSCNIRCWNELRLYSAVEIRGRTAEQ